ncbi:C_GCAxxG_C_C family protein [candidate division KSB1 bacterium]|nr:C_GCAxxG_C_C family protein [candidate division KSB1 bacterium]
MKAKISENASGYYMSGLNCAEAVLRAALEQIESVDKEIFRMATPFGGGVGGTKQELCGALAGGVMAIGYLCGRTDAEVDAGPSKAIAAILRERFVQSAGKTQCQILIDEFGPEQQKEKCAVLVFQTAGWVVDLLEEHESLK